MDRSRFSVLLELYINKQCSVAEEAELAELLDMPEHQQEHLQVLGDFINTIPLQQLPGKPYANEVVQAILNVNSDLTHSTADQNAGPGDLPAIRPDTNIVSPVHRIHFLKTTWFRYAAVLLLLAGAATFLYLNNQHRLKDGDTVARAKQRIVLPGGNKATLTLSDGNIIVLDSAANGQLADQGGVQIVKLANGQIAYDLRGLRSKELMWNTMSTPKGGQYQVTLPDGTKVWLNASSSITFPTAFTGDKREVKITGETYLEIAKNNQKPFVVDVNGKSSVEVLGTSFNVNAYTDEASIKTTLIEGSVRVSATPPSSDPQLKSSRTVGDHLPSVVLKPGYQAMVAYAGRQPGYSDIQIQSADISKALAWKNGIFDFTGADLKTVMRQLERWYDIKVQYKGSVSNTTFGGRMYRNVNLSDVLEVLQEMGVKFELDGKNLTVL